MNRVNIERLSGVFSNKDLCTDHPAYPDERLNAKSTPRTAVFNASTVSAIYGLSDTVQPAGLFAQCLIRYE